MDPRRTPVRGWPAGAPLERILDVAIQTAWGLAHAHRLGMVHQDVKPANVLLDSAGNAKVSDFGLARAGELLAGPSSAGPRRRHASGHHRGYRRDEVWELFDSARPFLTKFLTIHDVAGRAAPEWTENDFDDLCRELQYAGFGRLRRSGVKAELDRMAERWNGPPKPRFAWDRTT